MVNINTSINPYFTGKFIVEEKNKNKIKKELTKTNSDTEIFEYIEKSADNLPGDIKLTTNNIFSRVRNGFQIKLSYSDNQIKNHTAIIAISYFPAAVKRFINQAKIYTENAEILKKIQYTPNAKISFDFRYRPLNERFFINSYKETENKFLKTIDELNNNKLKLDGFVEITPYKGTETKYEMQITYNHNNHLRCSKIPYNNEICSNFKKYINDLQEFDKSISELDKVESKINNIENQKLDINIKVFKYLLRNSDTNIILEMSKTLEGLSDTIQELPGTLNVKIDDYEVKLVHKSDKIRAKYIPYKDFTKLSEEIDKYKNILKEIWYPTSNITENSKEVNYWDIEGDKEDISVIENLARFKKCSYHTYHVAQSCNDQDTH